MPIKSLKNSLYIFIAAILMQACVIGYDYYFRHRVELSRKTHVAIQEVEQFFLETLIAEKIALLGSAKIAPLTHRYQRLIEMIREAQLGLDLSTFDLRNRHYSELALLKLEHHQLRDHLNRILPSLASSVRYIHEHHIAYLKNLLSRGKSVQDYDTGKDFKRSPVHSAPELDIVQTVVAIQNSILDIFDTFSGLDQGGVPEDISLEFHERIQTFYLMINTLEDYSLNAQDSLLVKEMLLNGRVFEDIFYRFLAIERRIQAVSAEKEKKQNFLMDQLKNAEAHIETSYLHLEKQIERLQKFSLLVNGFMLFFLLLFSRHAIKAIRHTIYETKRIQKDITYQIPVQKSDFYEFGTIYNALNAMADTINNQLVKLEESRNLMEERVAKRTRELSHVNQKLLSEIKDRIENEQQRFELETKLSRAKKMEAIGTLAGGVAHDLNNILSGIISYPELILMDLPEDHPLRDSVMTIKSSGEKAAIIVQDLLTLARRGIATHDPVDLNAIVKQFINSPECAKILLYHSSVRIESHLARDIGFMSGSQVHLSKTIMNLVSNAAEAMPDGGVIHITTTQQYLDIGIKGYDDVREGEYLKLSVRDDGEGIAEEDLERVFEPFFTKKQMGRSGTGLGMAVVWGTVKDHAGYIDVESEPGNGTTFTLYFPLSRDARPYPPDNIIQPELYKGNGEIVLVVDDVREQRDIATRILEKLGYRVVSVSSGEAAVTYLEEHPADILLLDMIMPPGINGLETYRRITTIVPGLKAVIASGFSETALVTEAQRLGAGPYLKKPYSFEQIGLAIREELDRTDVSVSP